MRPPFARYSNRLRNLQPDCDIPQADVDVLRLTVPLYKLLDFGTIIFRSLHMPSTPSALTNLCRNELIHQEAVSRYAPARRFASLFTEASPSDARYFLDSGLVKIFKRGEDGKEIILRVVAPGELFGEQALVAEDGRKLSAEILQEGVIYVIPKSVFNAFCDSHP